MSVLPGTTWANAFLYPRTIDVHRAETVAAGTTNIGLVSYSGLAQGAGTGTLGETVIATAIPCTIQPKGAGRVRGLGLLPGDAPGPPQWQIFIPLAAIAKGVIRDRDILIDDEGYRYQVSQAGWQSLGYEINAIRLES